MELKNPYNNGETATKELQGLDVASPLKKARWYFGTGLNKVDEIRYGFLSHLMLLQPIEFIVLLNTFFAS